MEKNVDDGKLPRVEFKNEIRKNVEYTRRVPNKDVEFKVKMWENERQNEQNKNLEVDDWSMYDGQYPRLGPIIFNKSDAKSKHFRDDCNV